MFALRVKIRLCLERGMCVKVTRTSANNMSLKNVDWQHVYIR